MDLPSASPYPYAGPEEWRKPVADALLRVVDPEVAMTIVDVGLIYGVTATEDRLHVVLTMTSPACPVTDLIIEEVETELEGIVPHMMRIEVELVWDPPWSTDRTSVGAEEFMGS